MNKLKCFFALFILNVAFVVSQAKSIGNAPVPDDLSKYLDDTDDEDEDIDEDTSDLHDGLGQDANHHEDGNEEDEDKDDGDEPLDSQKVIQALNDVLSNPDKRKELKAITDKWRDLFINTKRQEAIRTIMKNINAIHGDPYYRELLQSVLTVSRKALADEDTRELIEMTHNLYQMMSTDRSFIETVKVVLNVIRSMKSLTDSILTDEESKRVLQSSIQIAQNVLAQRHAIMDVAMEAFRIINDPAKVEFMITTGRALAPSYGALQQFLGLNSQTSGLVLSQPKARTKKPAPRKLTIKKN
ncbi:coiled-coil domain-containing protein 1-like isoform X1 [Diaphorina citri]|uniref:Coiled-coil domain-containing protein 1-like isoform X1 n=1 Tax=Diaphorina citri TaxID=121845 RepID=A0A1S3CXG1_DIACI|nr:coiled-coil domain-containing protein 1-like isoform X1 [Diaphorina citri]KAI5706633.1 hypothetical protein M8J75_009946 [Diaphorina citri]KAI5740644.1 hypothetical protein M8J76_005806 [Diaphorina citri]KAI5746140.1 hypothetical protein M8J77_000287 [Diaphorina citri]